MPKTKRSRKRRAALAPSVPMQKSKLLKFRYCTNDVLSPGANSIDYMEVRANGMFDPDASIGGHQPMGFDNYVGVFYDHFTVLKSKITVEAFSTTSVPAIIGIHLDDDEGGMSGINNNFAREMNNNTWKGLSVTNGGSDHVKLTRTFDAKKFFGVNPLGGSIYRGTVSADPTEQAIFTVWCSGVAAASDPGNVEVAVTIEYEAMLTEPKQLAQS